ncbi:hypothetical protein [Methanococcus voltae]|uniref:5'-deoxynucleotidase YfbR-like HD superfamily hydrolase n=1 Tax=Methanococcus voltae PS TaxID=523842 RepID=A0ABT2EVP3_METVO|nr:hypothetical protein [Methanococcus voltae]MBP2173083.1 5'-deoxynucleotidase YfbR-like HD superfamily hydrolase [Methanococcus voltae]MCS3922025.1 5'-deoxynucleotidase YfbR-like HD superfamily hydrolase [Methanococcus voltae PS]
MKKKPVSSSNYRHEFSIDYKIQTNVKEDRIKISNGKKYRVYSRVSKIEKVLKKGFKLYIGVFRVSYNKESGKYELYDTEEKNIYKELDDIEEYWRMFQIM